MSDPVIEGSRVHADVECVGKDDSHAFRLMARYDFPLGERDRAFVRMAMAVPLLNYGLFSEELRFDYELSHADKILLEDMLNIFSRDIFVNKLARTRTAHIISEYAPAEEEIILENSRPRAVLSCKAVCPDKAIAVVAGESCGVLSSGGKESLLTYGILKEIGADVHPLYVVESGGHWRTAITAYRHHNNMEPNTEKVWSNIDRFYNFMLDHLHFIKPRHRKMWADVYPIRLCVFPHYVFLLLPVFARKSINNLLLGSEFDDLRETPVFRGIEHHNGVYDQTQEFDIRMEDWYSKRLPGMRQWSAVRPLSGMVVERILVKRYPVLASLQRSCHSCRLEDETVLPCGKCSKCLGVLLFLAANNFDPEVMKFSVKDMEMLPQRLSQGGLKLDQEEMEHSINIAGRADAFGGKPHPHVETIHVHPPLSDLCLFPRNFRSKILDIMEEHTTGYTRLVGDSWEPVSRAETLERCP